MGSKKHVVIFLTLFVIISGFTASITFIPGNSNSGDDINDNPNQTNRTGTSSSSSSDVSATNFGSDWELILSENETFADGESGYGSAELSFEIESVYRLSTKLHLIAELCTACGGTGRGEISILITMPSGEIGYKNVFTSTTDLNLLWTNPAEGEWQIFIEGFAVGEDFEVGYSAEILTIDSE